MAKGAPEKGPTARLCVGVGNAFTFRQLCRILGKSHDETIEALLRCYADKHKLVIVRLGMEPARSARGWARRKRAKEASS